MPDATTYCNWISTLRFMCSKTANSIIAPATKNTHVSRNMPRAVNCPDEGFDAYFYKYQNGIYINFQNSILQEYSREFDNQGSVYLLIDAYVSKC